jgi:hypothetical protein
MISNEKYVQFFRDQWKMDITPNGDGYNANGFDIQPEQDTETRQTIRGEISVNITVWVVEAPISIPASYWEPEEVDMEEMARERDLGTAFMRVLLIQHEDDIGNSLQDFCESTANEQYLKEMAQ